MKFPELRTGLVHCVETAVRHEDTVDYYMPAGFDTLLSTPGLVALMQKASIELTDTRLPDEFITVGKSAEVTHEHPAVLGSDIRIKVEIVEFDGYHIRLKMTASNSMGIVGHGFHVRSIVNERWMRMKIQRRIASL